MTVRRIYKDKRLPDTLSHFNGCDQLVIEPTGKKHLHTDCLMSVRAVLKSMHVNVDVFLLGSCGSLVQISETVNNGIQLLLVTIQNMKF